MERKKFLMDVLEDLQKDVKEQLDYVQDILKIITLMILNKLF